jgi:hypothetical protein
MCEHGDLNFFKTLSSKNSDFIKIPEHCMPWR